VLLLFDAREAGQRLGQLLLAALVRCFGAREAALELLVARAELRRLDHQLRL
jgi:hypothetical protein